MIVHFLEVHNSQGSAVASAGLEIDVGSNKIKTNIKDAGNLIV